MARFAALLTLLVLTALPLRAQPPALDLETGGLVRVRGAEPEGRRWFEGRVMYLRGDTLWLREPVRETPHAFDTRTLQAVEVYLGRSRSAGARRGALWGAFLGASVGGIAGGLAAQSLPGGVGTSAAAGGLGGAALGAAFGSAFLAEQWRRYRLVR